MYTIEFVCRVVFISSNLCRISSERIRTNYRIKKRFYNNRRREIFRSDGRQEEEEETFLMAKTNFQPRKKKQFAHRRIPRAQARKREDTHTHQDENGQRGSRGVINIPRISDDQE